MYKDNKMPLATVVGSIEANSNPSGFWACLIPQRYAPLYLCLHKNAPSVITLKSFFCFFLLTQFRVGLEPRQAASLFQGYAHIHIYTQFRITDFLSPEISNIRPGGQSLQQLFTGRLEDVK